VVDDEANSTRPVAEVAPNSASADMHQPAGQEQVFDSPTGTRRFTVNRIVDDDLAFPPPVPNRRRRMSSDASAFPGTGQLQ
jgi:hypothetical protein